MTRSFYAKYNDDFGQAIVQIKNDGKILQMFLRNVEFTGVDFYNFEPSNHAHDIELAQFNLFGGELCAYILDCEVPLLFVEDGQTYESILHIHVEYGEPVDNQQGTLIRDPNGNLIKSNKQIEHEVLQLKVNFHGNSFESGGESNYNSFDEQLIELQALFPENAYLKTCWSCAFSDYPPSGSGQFGGLACFRNNKEEYLCVRTKRELMSIWDKRAELVQEIYCCPEFEKRQPGQGGLYVG